MVRSAVAISLVLGMQIATFSDPLVCPDGCRARVDCEASLGGSTVPPSFDGCVVCQVYAEMDSPRSTQSTPLVHPVRPATVSDCSLDPPHPIEHPPRQA